MLTAISKDDFSLLVASEISKSGVDSKSLHIDKNDFAIRRKDERGQVLATLYLANLFAGYNDATTKKERERIVSRLVKLWQIPPELETYEQAKSRILPVVRARLNYPEAPTSGQEYGYPQIKISEHLTTLLAFDTEDTIFPLSDFDFSRWNVTLETAFEDAFENFKTRVGSAWQVFESDDNPEDCAYVFEGEDDYGSSILIFPALIADFEVLGEPIIFAPAKNIVVVTGSDSLYGLQYALDVIVESEFKQNALIPEMLCLDEELSYFGCDLPEEHPLYQEFNKINLVYTARIYEQFFQQLEGGFDELVSSKRIVKYDVVEMDDEYFSEISFGIEEGPITMPSADLVKIVTPDREIFIPFAVVAEVADDQLVKINEYPPVFELVRPLSYEQLDAMLQQDDTEDGDTDE